MLSVKLSSRARGVDQMLLVECFKEEHYPNKAVLFCKGQRAPDSLTAKANWPRPQLNHRERKIRNIRNAKKGLTAGNPRLKFPQLTQVDTKVDATTINKGTMQMGLLLYYIIMWHPPCIMQGSKRGSSSLGPAEFSIFYFWSPTPALAAEWDNSWEIAVGYS